MATSEPTYGNWRQPTSPGVAGLGLLGTAILMGGMIVAIIAAMVSPLLGLAVALAVAVALAPLLIRDRDQRTALQRLSARIAWIRARRAGWYLYRSGPLSIIDGGACRLPGLAATSRVYEARDSYDRPFAMIELPAVGHYTVVLECAADGSALLDAHQRDAMVANWGHWLATLGAEPSLIAASVTVETSPDPGTRLSGEVATRLAHQAPQLARQVLHEVVRTYPAGSAQVTTRIALTYSAVSSKGRRAAERMAREIGIRLPGLSAALAATGAGVARPMTATQLAEAIRIAYDPASHALIEQARGQEGSGLTWDQAGPMGHQEAWDHYVHDSGVSITWAMADAPRGEVHSDVLHDLIAPHPDIARKRVTMLYRPHDPATAARIVERDKRDARFRLGGAAIRERDTVAAAAAAQSAREEARGAGVVRFALLVTATVERGQDLELAAAAIDTLAPTARLRLRRCRGQAAAFAAALPLGIVIPHHLQVPQVIHDML